MNYLFTNKIFYSRPKIARMTDYCLTGNEEMDLKIIKTIDKKKWKKILHNNSIYE